MKLVTQDSETKILEAVEGLRPEPDGYYALHFHLSQLGELYRSQYQIKIATTILSDLFKAQDATAFVMQDLDIILIYNGNSRGLLENAIFQMRVLFMDDPLAYDADGLENSSLCNFYDIAFQWHDLFAACTKKATPLQIVQATEKSYILTAEELVRITNDITNTNISETLRNQPICAIVPGREPKIIFDEFYINIRHLSELLNIEVDISSSKTLFKHLTKTFDKNVLDALKLRSRNDNKFAVSLNLNIRSLFAEEFAAFDNELTAQKKSSTIIEIQAADVFEDFPRFLMAREIIKQLGYRICLDGLDSIGFTQIDRKSLGFDLAKLQWHPELASLSDSEILAQAIKRCDPNRVILCHCDSFDAIEYGQSIGISLFQGRYVDNMLYPQAKVVN